ncbi:hypothetical protein [Neomegalonema perideroedes]|uniref:hypothetical protein n=1 Tax=Neomegalonema perideroedes TaxID=217219 RepID=UPI000370479A|nr:hypothetical protein [Neomegalonema perideroedes]
MAGEVKGWCPGARRPMESGDGLILRLRPHGGRLTPDQAQALADLAETYGDGAIELSARAHPHLRGVRPEVLPEIHRILARHGLLDAEADMEARRNILVAPLWRAEDHALEMAAALEAALGEAPPLPAKFGFALDLGPQAILGGASADIRIERSPEGLILRAEGMALGEPVSAEEAPAKALALAHWFAENRGEAGRMARLIGSGLRPPLAAAQTPLTAAPPGLGPQAPGFHLAFPFGRVEAEALRSLARAPLRLTPWRSAVVEGLREAPDIPGLILDPLDPLLRVSACVGAPGCASAEGATRDLARSLAALVPQGARLHVSGCAKGCAHPRPAEATLLARPDGRFDFIRDGSAKAPPHLTGLASAEIPAILRGSFAPSL